MIILLIYVYSYFCQVFFFLPPVLKILIKKKCQMLCNTMSSKMYNLNCIYLIQCNSQLIELLIQSNLVIKSKRKGKDMPTDVKRLSYGLLHLITRNFND